MAYWLEQAMNVLVGAFVLGLLIKYRDRGILKRIMESKKRVRAWMIGRAA